MEALQSINSFLLGLKIVWQVALAQAVGFVILLVVVWRFLFKPVGAIMQQREEQIANQLTNAEAQQLRAESLRKEYEEHLARVADEARERFEQAMKDAEAARQRSLAQAQAEVRELYQRHQEQMNVDRESLRRELRGELSDLAVLAANKALRGQMTPTIQSAVIDQVINELSQLQA